MIRGEGVEVVLVDGGGEGCDEDGGGGVVEGDEEEGVVISCVRGVVVPPLPFSSRGSWMSALHSE